MIKRSVASKYSLSRVPSNPEILALLDPDTRERVRSLLLLKATRSASGVVVVAAMTSPHPCPHGSCIYCPGGPKSNTPQSYTGHEPAAMRAISNNFDPRRQVKQRLKQLEEMGHSTDKVELIVMGGTFLSFPREYQRWFVSECLNALTDSPPSTLEEAKERCRTSKRRNVAITVETRPDYCREQHVDSMLDMGVTRVEIGLQTVYDDVLSSVGRGHSVEDSVNAIRIAKDAGLKVAVHMMPGLPGSGEERDVEAFKVLFEDERFRPDMLKIYPTLVISGTVLEQMFRRGLYSPLDDRTASRIVSRAFAMAPRWLRIMRVQRDIPAHQILAGPRHGNLRELALELLASEGVSSSEIRGREVGASMEPRDEGVELKRTSYAASSGQEVFLEVVRKSSDRLFAYLRLRRPSQRAHRPELRGGDCAIVRELKVLGRATPLGAIWEDSRQHRGYGSFLMAEAERTAREDWGASKLLVISALGTKEYYSKLGYLDDGPYMSKAL
jgi:elongator complex protein 3